jgi:hypothetical protein
VFILKVIFGLTIFLLFIFALVVLSRVILLSKQVERVEKVLNEAEAKLNGLKGAYNADPADGSKK